MRKFELLLASLIIVSGCEPTPPPMLLCSSGWQVPPGLPCPPPPLPPPPRPWFVCTDGSAAAPGQACSIPPVLFVRPASPLRGATTARTLRRAGLSWSKIVSRLWPG